MENTDPAGVDNVVVRLIYKVIVKCSFIISYQNMMKKRLRVIHLEFWVEICRTTHTRQSTNEKHAVQ